MAAGPLKSAPAIPAEEFATMVRENASTRLPDGTILEHRPARPGVEYVYGPGARTCVECHWGYDKGGTGPGDQASDQRCHYCASLLALLDQELNRKFVRSQRTDQRLAAAMLTVMIVVLFAFILALGWT